MLAFANVACTSMVNSWYDSGQRLTGTTSNAAPAPVAATTVDASPVINRLEGSNIDEARSSGRPGPTKAGYAPAMIV